MADNKSWKNSVISTKELLLIILEAEGLTGLEGTIYIHSLHSGAKLVKNRINYFPTF